MEDKKIIAAIRLAVRQSHDGAAIWYIIKPLFEPMEKRLEQLRQELILARDAEAPSAPVYCVEVEPGKWTHNDDPVDGVTNRILYTSQNVRRDELKRVAEAAVKACRAAYSPDDTAGDWDDKMASIDLPAIIQSVAGGGMEVPDGWREFLERWVIPHMERARAAAFFRGDGSADGYLEVLNKTRTEAGDMAALGEFFDIFRFDDNQFTQRAGREG